MHSKTQDIISQPTPQHINTHKHTHTHTHTLNHHTRHTTNPNHICTHIVTHTTYTHRFISMYVYIYTLTILNINGSVSSVKPYNIVNSTLKDITIACISYSDSRNISSSWIKWSITEPCNVYWRCPTKKFTINYDI